MGEKGVAQRRIRQTGQHSHLYHVHDLAAFWTYHCEAENFVVTCGDKGLHKAIEVRVAKLPMSAVLRAHTIGGQGRRHDGCKDHYRALSAAAQRPASDLCSS